MTDACYFCLVETDRDFLHGVLVFRDEDNYMETTACHPCFEELIKEGYNERDEHCRACRNIKEPVKS